MPFIRVFFFKKEKEYFFWTVLTVTCKIHGKSCNFDEIFKTDMKKMTTTLLKRSPEKAHDSEDEMYPAYRLTKSYLNLAHISLICSDTLPINLEFFGKMQKKNAY